MTIRCFQVGRLLLVVAAVGGLCSDSAAVVVLDQVHDLPQFQIAIGTGVNATTQVAQTFTVGQQGILDHVDLAIDVNDGAVGDLEFSLQTTVGGAPSTGAPLFTTPISLGSIGDFSLDDVYSTSVDVSSANLFVQPGEVLAWTLARPSSSEFDVFSFAGGGNYSGGTPFERFSSGVGWSPEGGSDRLFRTFVDTDATSGSTTLDPVVTANVQLDGGSYVLEEDPFRLDTYQNLSSGIDDRAVLEYSLATIPENARLTAATLHLDVTLRTFSDDEYPDVPVFGYEGDGMAHVNDANVTANLLGHSDPITENEPLDISLDIDSIDQLRETGAHLGLVMIGSANRNQAGFENFSSHPTLVLDYEFGLAGDYNEDGVVDAADYTVWRDHLGAQPGTLANDVDGGAIGTAQYATWVDNFGNTSGGGSSAGGSIAASAVPEPASALLLLLIGVASPRPRGRAG